MERLAKECVDGFRLIDIARLSASDVEVISNLKSPKTDFRILMAFSKVVDALLHELSFFIDVGDETTESTRSSIAIVDSMDTDESGRADERLNFAISLSGALRALRFPLLFENDADTPAMADRLNDGLFILQVVRFLIGQVQTSRLLAVKYPQQLPTVRTEDADGGAGDCQSDRVLNAACADTMQRAVAALGLPPPKAEFLSPEKLAPRFYGEVERRLKAMAPADKQKILGKPLLKLKDSNARLSVEEWKKVEDINGALFHEYSLRRRMLLTRLDVTFQSFLWSKLAKQREDEVAGAYQPVRRELRAGARKPTAAQVLTAREDELLDVRKTCDATLRAKTRSDVNTVAMGRVPDRGGRANELEPPAPEMPSFAPRQAGQGGGGGRGGGGGGFGRGGGGYQGHGDQRAQSARGGYGGGGGGYQGNNNNYHQPMSNFEQYGGGGGYQQQGGQGYGGGGGRPNTGRGGGRGFRGGGRGRHW